jgi:hypothetical protein
MNYLPSSPINISTLSDDYHFFSVWSPMSVSPCLSADWGPQKKRPIIKANEQFDMLIDKPLSAAHYFNALNFQANYQPQEPIRRLFCRFCFDNRESEAIYTSHEQYDINGNIKCPILKVVSSGSLSPTSKPSFQAQTLKLKENLPQRSQALEPKERMELLNSAKQSINGNSNKCKKLWCIFCRNNKEPEEIYRSHVLKDSDGKTTCPILQKHICPICSATGEQAHTITYCKEFKKNNRQKILQKAKFKIGL